jgi:hypothetical protein
MNNNSNFMSQLTCLMFTALLTVTSIVHAQSGAWTEVAKFPGHRSGGGILWFFDDSTALLALNGNPNGMILRTTDAGLSWNAVQTPAVNSNNEAIHCSDIYFHDKFEGWFTFFYGATSSCLWHTTDGGLSLPNTSLWQYSFGVRQTSHAVVVNNWVDQNTLQYLGSCCVMQGTNYADVLHLDVSSLRSGSYQLRFETSSGIVATKNIVVIK